MRKPMGPCSVSFTLSAMAGIKSSRSQLMQYHWSLLAVRVTDVLVTPSRVSSLLHFFRPSTHSLRGDISDISVLYASP